MQTSLIGRKVINGWDGKPNGTIVGVFVDRGEVHVIIERPVNSSTDGRTELTDQLLGGTILAKDDLESWTKAAETLED